jgi:hypothetical protein
MINFIETSEQIQDPITGDLALVGTCETFVDEVTKAMWKKAMKSSVTVQRNEFLEWYVKFVGGKQ